MGEAHFNFSNYGRSLHTFSYKVYKTQDLKTFFKHLNEQK